MTRSDFILVLYCIAYMSVSGPSALYYTRLVPGYAQCIIPRSPFSTFGITCVLAYMYLQHVIALLECTLFTVMV